MIRRYRLNDEATVYATRAGQLVAVIDGAEQLTGPYPDKSWDEHFDVDMIKIRPIRREFFKIPHIIIGPVLGYCRGPVYDEQFHNQHLDLLLADRWKEAAALQIIPRCDVEPINTEFCSQQCWFINMTSCLKELIMQREDRQARDFCNERAELIKSERLQLARLWHHFGSVADEWATYRDRWIM